MLRLHEIEYAAGLDVHWLPMIDEDAPDIDDAIQAIKWMSSLLANGEKLMVHYRYGIGRTGTMLTAWLLKQGYRLEDALVMLGHTPAAPKSRRQWDFLDAYSRSLGQAPIARSGDLEQRRSRLGRFFRGYMILGDRSAR